MIACPVVFFIRKELIILHAGEEWVGLELDNGTGAPDDPDLREQARNLKRERRSGLARIPRA